ncbi:MAG TPA: hypothetical protein VK152_04795 [Paludibacter sp.]|nr:hypothetical protein [Paludibacter sp.]
MIDKELVRCRPCGYVMKASDLGDVCPACGLPRNVFEPYRERVSANRLFILNLDIHPIAIHLSQSFVALIPIMMVFHLVFPRFQENIVHPVINFFVFALPFSLVLSFTSGVIDGITRFKTLRTPMLRSKIVFSILIFATSIANLVLFTPSQYNWLTLVLSLAAFAFAVKLGLIGKRLLDVILPGAYVPRGKKVAKPAPQKPADVMNEEPTEN